MRETFVLGRDRTDDFNVTLTLTAPTFSNGSVLMLRYSRSRPNLGRGFRASYNVASPEVFVTVGVTQKAAANRLLAQQRR